jgi:OFA family oxalate/formate antiporter-like MFS transporter
MVAPSSSGTVQPTRGRWGIAAAAVLFQLALGAVYAWSVFSSELKKHNAFALTKSEAALPFSVTIGMIFLGTYLGGRIQDKRGPRTVAMTGGVIYSVGILLAAAAGGKDQLWLLVLGYGVIAGFGLGLGYIVPVAMLQKWFPDKRGLITGIAVGGFGFGAFVTSPVAQQLVEGSRVPTRAFLPLGIAYLIMTVAGSWFFRNPPAGYAVPGWQPRTEGRIVDAGRDYTTTDALRTPQWYLLTGILALNVTAGIGLISVAKDAAIDVGGYTSAAAGTLVGALALFNGGGRIFFGWISDRVGRMPAFLAMLGLQAICFLILPHATSVGLFAVLAAVIYLCYGGGFGTMPATAGDFFGLRNAGAIYGLMIVAWSAGGVLGPLLTAALIDGKVYTTAFTTIAVIAIVGMALPLITRPPRQNAPAAASVAADEPTGQPA